MKLIWDVRESTPDGKPKKSVARIPGTGDKSGCAVTLRNRYSIKKQTVSINIPIRSGMANMETSRYVTKFDQDDTDCWILEELEKIAGDMAETAMDLSGQLTDSPRHDAYEYQLAAMIETKAARLSGWTLDYARKEKLPKMLSDWQSGMCRNIPIRCLLEPFDGIVPDSRKDRQILEQIKDLIRGLQFQIFAWTSDYLYRIAEIAESEPGMPKADGILADACAAADYLKSLMENGTGAYTRGRLYADAIVPVKDIRQAAQDCQPEHAVKAAQIVSLADAAEQYLKRL